MNLLLDTHAFLWWVMDDDRLSSQAKAAMVSTANVLFLSVGSSWEISIKTHTGKLRLPETAETFIPRQAALNGIQHLTIELPHVLHVDQLPDLHNDPFDRVLISQAQLEQMTIVTRDENIRRYDVNTLW